MDMDFNRTVDRALEWCAWPLGVLDATRKKWPWWVNVVLYPVCVVLAVLFGIGVGFFCLLVLYPYVLGRYVVRWIRHQPTDDL